MEEGKQLLEWDEQTHQYSFVRSGDSTRGKRYILEMPLHADVALIHAY
jgi:acyl CoA:acetate/3-ketoacid CoA transferase alpha subunit